MAAPPAAPQPQQLQLRVALANDDLHGHPRDQVPSWRQAHDFLTRLRDGHGATAHQQDLHDLTDSSQWLAALEDIRRLLAGADVWQFAFVWTNAFDPKRREQRGDFLVR